MHKKRVNLFFQPNARNEENKKLFSKSRKKNLRSMKRKSDAD